MLFTSGDDDSELGKIKKIQHGERVQEESIRQSHTEERSGNVFTEPIKKRVDQGEDDVIMKWEEDHEEAKALIGIEKSTEVRPTTAHAKKRAAFTTSRPTSAHPNRFSWPGYSSQLEHSAGQGEPDADSGEDLRFDPRKSKAGMSVSVRSFPSRQHFDDSFVKGPVLFSDRKRVPSPSAERNNLDYGLAGDERQDLKARGPRVDAVASVSKGRVPRKLRTTVLSSRALSPEVDPYESEAVVHRVPSYHKVRTGGSDRPMTAARLKGARRGLSNSQADALFSQQQQHFEEMLYDLS